jgi:hypothetical protein
MLHDQQKYITNNSRIIKNSGKDWFGVKTKEQSKKKLKKKVKLNICTCDSDFDAECLFHPDAFGYNE